MSHNEEVKFMKDALVGVIIYGAVIIGGTYIIWCFKDILFGIGFH